jgi:hypothetical protein
MPPNLFFSSIFLSRASRCRMRSARASSKGIGHCPAHFHRPTSAYSIPEGQTVGIVGDVVPDLRLDAARTTPAGEGGENAGLDF